MRKFTFTLIFAVFALAGMAQRPTMELTFTAANNGQYVTLDSIFVENLTQGGDTTLYAPDTVLVLDYVTGIGNREVIKANTFSVSQNYPNPFKGKTEVNLCLPESDDIKITIRDILGRELAHYQNTLNRGNHVFSFYPCNGKYYLLTVTGAQTSQTIKMLNAGSNTTNGEKCKLVYTGNKGSLSGFKSHQAINIFVYNLGDELKYIAYTDVEETEIIDFPTGSQIYTFQFDGWTPCSGSSTITDFDGNPYNTVQIGDQCWMKENLKTTTYQNGTPIPNVTNGSSWSNLTTGAYVWHNNDISWKDLYGALYNWYTTVDANGLCPTGWHLPSDEEWKILEGIVDSQYPVGDPEWDYLGWRGLDVGKNLKSKSGWNNNGNGIDLYGFGALPGGSRFTSGSFYYLGYNGYWWSSSEGSGTGAWYRSLYDDGSYRYYSYWNYGLSVRCLKDY